MQKRVGGPTSVRTKYNVGENGRRKYKLFSGSWQYNSRVQQIVLSQQHATSAEDENFVAIEVSLNVACVGIPTQHVSQQRYGNLAVREKVIYALALEQRLSSEGLEDTGEDELIRFPDETNTFPDHSFPDLVPAYSQDSFEKEGSNSSSSNGFGVDIVFSQPGSTMTMPLTGLSPISFINDLTRSDLDHLYFDRFHSFFPILNKRHYFARARRICTESDVDSFHCLQHVMWTLAVSTSSQFQHIQDDLYSQTRLLIENLETKQPQSDCIDLEQVQAWGLLSVYEFMHVGYRRAWMSAGKFFRYVILMKLHNVDGLDGIAANQPQTLNVTEIEERRRTFWMAYTIDQITSLLDRLPLTFDQHIILTRLPCSEKEFQSDEVVVTEFLRSLPLQTDNQPPSTFTDSIQLIGICGQLLSHQQQGAAEHTQGLMSLPLWDRQQQLDAGLEQALKGMSLDDPYTLIFQGPMVYFTVLAAQASALVSFTSCRTAPWAMEDTTKGAAQREKRAVEAAQQMTTLSKALIELSYFKVLCPDTMSL
ncbi:DNA binding [Ascochyta rabiei]|uniref:DNA binding n=1 Tax=Didymella rabiei TaxID=5454 RepID=A0A163CB05_DIDRA|nr:DNA binding [Ascochyta rabiei]